MQGSFITSGNTFDAFAAVGKALARATRFALSSIPYADRNLLEQYTLLAQEGIEIRILTRQKQASLLLPAARHWANQFGSTRPLEIPFLPGKPTNSRLAGNAVGAIS
jgi:hypothetical protein